VRLYIKYQVTCKEPSKCNIYYWFILDVESIDFIFWSHNILWFFLLIESLLGACYHLPFLMKLGMGMESWYQETVMVNQDIGWSSFCVFHSYFFLLVEWAHSGRVKKISKIINGYLKPFHWLILLSKSSFGRLLPAGQIWPHSLFFE